MLATMYKVECKICGGENAPIVSGKHLDESFCREYIANKLLFGLLNRHADMLNRPDHFSKDNPTKQTYYGLLNRSLELIKLGLKAEKDPPMP